MERTEVISRATGAAKKRDELQRTLLHALMRRRGLEEGHYALFFVTGEGAVFPVGPSGLLIEEVRATC